MLILLCNSVPFYPEIECLIIYFSNTHQAKICENPFSYCFMYADRSIDKTILIGAQ
jgi:hypothetical protein